MLFNSPMFLLFAIVVFSLYGLLRRPRLRRLLLLVSSYLFYAHWDYRYLPLLLLSTSVDFVVGKAICAGGSAGRRRALLLASALTNLGLLGVFKYGNFFLQELVAPWWPLDTPLPSVSGEIPIGLSFYTFQTLSYTIDCYRGRTRATESLLDFALYVAFFPQLIAGPIVRANQLLPQLSALASLKASRIAEGAQRFLLGLFKKVVIADNAGLFVDTVFSSPESFGAVTLWCGMYAFSLQIYCDFSGYTDMALGLARAMGVKLPENFKTPYLAGSITDFWRRWHISLSQWLRDYVYIPLGGSRRGSGRTYANLLVTMLLGGLWHGAGWTFVLWGGFHGVLLAVERALKVRRNVDASSSGAGIRAFLRWAVTFHVVCLGWVLFRAPDLETLSAYLGGLFTGPWIREPSTDLGLAWGFVTLALVAFHWISRRTDLRGLWNGLHPSLQGAGLAAAVIAVSLLYVDQVAFIYFQF